MSGSLSQAQINLISANNDLASRDPSLQTRDFVTGAPINSPAAPQSQSQSPQQALNDPYAPGYATRPLLRVLLNSGGPQANQLSPAQLELISANNDLASRDPNLKPVAVQPAASTSELPQCFSASITSNNHFQADRFDLIFIPMPSGAGSLQWWSQQTYIPVEIQLGYLPLGASSDATPSWQSMLTGEVDKVTLEPSSNTVHCEGRDLTARFIDNKTTGSYVNQSSSEIVSTLAASRGLTAQISTSPGTTGRFWDDGRETSTYNQTAKNTTEWDLIVSLAKKEGYDAFVQGTTLYFQPPTADNAPVYILLYQIDEQGRHVANVTNLHMSRNITVAKGLNVKVKSWHSKKGAAIEKTSSTKASIGPNDKTLAQEYVIQKPNLTEDEAQNMADQTAEEFAKHEITITCSMPGDMILDARTLISLQGTGTDFDQNYFATSITRDVSASAGFSMHMSAKNKAKDDGAAAQADPTQVQPSTSGGKAASSAPRSVPIIGNASGGEALS